jgi:D-cysteine desulfhydrase
VTTWPLFERYPGLAERLKPITLAVAPTPVEPLERLSTDLGLSLWIKRDDLSSPWFGGNKARKLEFLLPEAIRHGARAIASVGGCGSNHLAATATFARQLGLATIGLVFAQPDNAAVRSNQAVFKSCGTTLLHADGARLLGETWRLIRDRRDLKPVYTIPGGGSCALGCLGMVNAAFELDAQIRAGLLPEPDRLFVPLGSCGTAAGLALGLALCGRRTRISAVRVVHPCIANRWRLRRLAGKTARLLGPGAEPHGIAHNIDLETGWLGRGYGHATAQSDEAIGRFLDREGIRLDPTYTAKAAAALLAKARAAQTRGQVWLFWLTCPVQPIPLPCRLRTQPGPASSERSS